MLTLKKGEGLNLSKIPNLNEILVGAGWNLNNEVLGADYDIDISLLVKDENGKASGDDCFVYWNALKGKGISKGIELDKDNRTGEGEGDDEKGIIKFSELSSVANEIDIHVVLYDGEEKKQDFSDVEKAYIRIVNNETNEELCRYNLEEFSGKTRIHAGTLRRKGTGFKFEAVGTASMGGNNEILKEAGMII